MPFALDQYRGGQGVVQGSIQPFGCNGSGVVKWKSFNGVNNFLSSVVWTGNEPAYKTSRMVETSVSVPITRRGIWMAVVMVANQRVP